MVLVDHLPAASNYIAALADDDQLADHAAEQAELRPAPPRLQDWSPVVAVLAVVADRLGELIRIQVARAGRKPPPLRPYPRPVTAADRARLRRKQHKHRELVARVLPGRG